MRLEFPGQTKMRWPRAAQVSAELPARLDGTWRWASAPAAAETLGQEAFAVLAGAAAGELQAPLAAVQGYGSVLAEPLAGELAETLFAPATAHLLRGEVRSLQVEMDWRLSEPAKLSAC